MLSDPSERHDPPLLPERVEQCDQLSQLTVDGLGSSVHARRVAAGAPLGPPSEGAGAGAEPGASPVLLGNLAALRSVDPNLAERITWPCQSDHVAWRADGVDYRIHRAWHRLSLLDDEVAAALNGVHTDAPTLLLGLGLGEVLDGLAPLATAPVLAWERDPWLLRQVLSLRDWAHEIRTGAVRFLLTADLLGVIEQGAPDQVLAHPLLGAVYRHEAALVRTGLKPRRALLGLGALFEEDVADALRSEGMSVVPWDLAGWSQEELGHVAAAVDAEVAVNINYTRGLAEACASLGVPVRVWEVDPSTDGLPPVVGGPQGDASQGAHIATWRESHVGLFEDAGFAHARFLPLASNTSRRLPRTLSAQETEHYAAPVTFVGASMVDQGLAFRRRLVGAYMLGRGGDPSEAMAEAEEAIESVLASQRADFSVYRVPELLAEALPMFSAPIANRAVRLALDGARADALLGEMAAADKRVTYVANLGQVGVHVWGDAGWQHATQYGAVYRGPAGHGAELTRIYNTDSIHLDLGRVYQSDIVTMRVFDVLACGGFCLAEHSPGLDALFEVGVELDSYRTLEEMLEKVAFWLDAGPEARREVGRRGRERVLRDHTIAARVRELLAA